MGRNRCSRDKLEKKIESSVSYGTQTKCIDVTSLSPCRDSGRSPFVEEEASSLPIARLGMTCPAAGLMIPRTYCANVNVS
jgi:hypothetical protein